MNWLVKYIGPKFISTIAHEHVEITCGFTGRRSTIEAGSVIWVTARLPVVDLLDGIRKFMTKGASLKSVMTIGDAVAP